MYLFESWFSPGRWPGVGLLDHMVVLFLVFLRALHTVFHSACTSLHSHQQCKKVPFSPLSPAFIVCRLFDDGCSTGAIMSYLIIVLICISLIINDVEHVSCVFGHLYVSLEKYLLRSSAHFLIFFLLLLSRYRRCLYILEINPLSVSSFAIIFSHSVGCLFILFMVSFAVQKLLTRSHLFIFVFIVITLGGKPEKIFLWFI